MTSASRGDIRVSARFFKAHGLGNDYVVFEAGEDWVLSRRGRLTSGFLEGLEVG